MFGKPKKPKKPKKPWVKCNHTWKEKTMGRDGEFRTVTRYCSKEKGHGGGHR
jgi:hypothetical protein